MLIDEKKKLKISGYLDDSSQISYSYNVTLLLMCIRIRASYHSDFTELIVHKLFLSLQISIVIF